MTVTLISQILTQQLNDGSIGKTNDDSKNLESHTFWFKLNRTTEFPLQKGTKFI